MESKRKANGHSATENDDRSAKRRKLAEFDLSKGETRESTTAYGMAFLEQIRRTADKSGRLVATYFENLLPREGNADYYKRTRMPICLTAIEDKLNKGDFKNLSELESYFKRMIANAKEFYPRSSAVFDDAERVRKALSNYMTKTNPAYQTRGYQAVPTPLPPEDGEEVEEEEEADEDAEGEEQEAEEQPAEEDNVEDDEEEEEEEEDDDDEEEDEEPASRRRSIIIKRSRGRPSRNSTSQTNTPRRNRASGRSDREYHNVPFKGLSFQQAQEKMVEDLLRYKEPEYEGYFEPFVNLPPRALRDYYRVITDPLSLKKLQKEVLGVQGRGDPTGISDFKSWSALAERAKLLWTNAYFYNEEGSEIHDLAQELEKAFNELLKKAKARSGTRSAQDQIEAPQTAQSIESPAASSQVNGTPRQPALEAARSVSVSVPSPSPSTHTALKAEESARMSPAVLAQTPGGPLPGPPTPVVQAPPVAAPPPGPPQIQSTNPMANGYVEPKRLRAPGKSIKDALLSRLRIQLHPSVHTSDPVLLDVLPLPHEMQQSGTVNLNANINRVFIVPMLPDLLQDRQYCLWVLIDKQPLKPCHQPIPNQLPQERAFDVMLHPGVNTIEAHVISAIPRHERVPGGPEVELEVFTAYVNVLRN
ncbi:polybromo-1 [Pochonia chlamydosporia 170]|uniref:Polybromo-1 n=1 Tax=Pochonia chlamydosporia 170 TaxID=1380566 RepID=A0A179FC42_METCM|nr:polybromo-1 [Pochonia chlamydosporia 170]OAQ63042.2 polybromo-1 [Pochonia chlamydosporia 170]